MIYWFVKKNFSILNALLYFVVELFENASCLYEQKLHSFWNLILSKKTNNKGLVIFLKILYYTFGVFAFVYLYVILKQIHTKLKLNHLRKTKLLFSYKESRKLSPINKYLSSTLYLLVKCKKYNLFLSK